MDEKGNILIKKVGRSNVYVKNIRVQGMNSQTSCVGKEIVEAKGRLEYNKAMKLFDISIFKNNIAQELRETYPERRKLEAQCISCITFVKDVNELLDNCSWIMIINIVALEMIKLKFNPNTKQNKTPPFVSIFDVSNETMFQDSNIIYKEPLMSLRRSNATKKWTHSNLNFGKKFQRVKKVSRNNFILPKFDYEVSEHGINQNVEKQRGRSMKFVKTFMFMHRYFSLMNF